MFIYKNVNPKNKKTNDCVIRAITCSLEEPYEKVRDDLYRLSCKLSFMLNDKRVYSKYLETKGYKKQPQLKDRIGTKLRVRQVAKLYPDAIIGTRKHLTCSKGGCIQDTWDTSNEVAGNFWVKE